MLWLGYEYEGGFGVAQHHCGSILDLDLTINQSPVTWRNQSGKCAVKKCLSEKATNV